MRTPHQTAVAIEKAVHQVNKFYSKTKSPKGHKGVFMRSMGKGISFVGRTYNGEPITTQQIETIITEAAEKFEVPASHIKTIGEWSY